jgi:hypothetical protein
MARVLKETLDFAVANIIWCCIGQEIAGVLDPVFRVRNVVKVKPNVANGNADIGGSFRLCIKTGMSELGVLLEPMPRATRTFDIPLNLVMRMWNVRQCSNCAGVVRRASIDVKTAGEIRFKNFSGV